jgi:hypothetical protein
VTELLLVVAICHLWPAMQPLENQHDVFWTMLAGVLVMHISCLDRLAVGLNVSSNKQRTVADLAALL